MARECMLTTVDNPYDPFTEYDKWLYFDEFQKGYYSSRVLARFAYVSDDLSDGDNLKEIEDAIDFIIKNDPLHIYKKAIKEETGSKHGDISENIEAS